jgi:hypothetical protein
MHGRAVMPNAVDVLVAVAAVIVVAFSEGKLYSYDSFIVSVRYAQGNVSVRLMNDFACGVKQPRGVR